MLRRLRTTLVAWYASTLVACILLFGICGIFVLHLVLMREIDATLVSTAGLLQTSVDELPREAPVSQRLQTIADETREVARGYRLAAFRLAGADGLMVTGGRFRLGPLPAGFSDSTVNGKPYRTYTRIGRDGSIAVAMSRHFDRELMHKSWLALAILSPLMLGMSIGGGLWLAARASAPIDAAFERLKRFTADVSHELRTPLAIVQAEVDVGLAKEEPAIQDLVRRLTRIGKANERMVQLVSDLFLWVRQDSGRLIMRRESLPVAELLEEVAAGLALVHPSIRFRVDAPEGLSCLGDPVHLRQALLNLAYNAAHHSRCGGEVVLSARAESSRATLAVEDHGAGISPDILQHLFDRFSRSGDRPGLGLGLAISRAIVDAHESTLEFATEPEVGTRFWFKIERDPVAASVHENATNPDLS